MQTTYDRPLTAEPIDWELARRFHGHLGPWLALGMRIGADGIAATGAKPHFGVRVHVRCRLRPPVSCLIDGLQWSTGATMGKRNIHVEEGDPFEVRILNDETGAEAVYAISEDAGPTFKQWIESEGEERATHRAWSDEGMALVRQVTDLQ
jgi:formylmethanofuran dehydrogenase subunit E